MLECLRGRIRILAPRGGAGTMTAVHVFIGASALQFRPKEIPACASAEAARPWPNSPARLSPKIGHMRQSWPNSLAPTSYETGHRRKAVFNNSNLAGFAACLPRGGAPQVGNVAQLNRIRVEIPGCEFPGTNSSLGALPAKTRSAPVRGTPAGPEISAASATEFGPSALKPPRTPRTEATPCVSTTKLP